MTLKWTPIKEENLKRDLIGYQLTANEDAVGDILEKDAMEVTLDRLVPQSDLVVGVLPVLKSGLKLQNHSSVRVSDGFVQY